MKRLLLFGVLVICANSPALSQSTSDSPQIAFYDYDPTLALNPDVKELPEKSEKQAELRTRYHLAYDSAHDQRVTAIFAIPKKFKPPYPAVILLAGSGGHKDTDYIRISADMMATLGYATISIDAQYHGERSRPDRSGDIHMPDSVTMRDAWVQTVIDLRRAVDYLESRGDIDMKKIGYFGFSQGAMIGGTFIGIDSRISMACLAVPGGGFLEWSKTRPDIKPDKAGLIATTAAITDPIHYIGRFSPRPLLILSAKRDELIPKSATDAIFSAAREPKEIKWYDATHVLTAAAPLVMRDAREFFIKHLGERQAAR